MTKQAHRALATAFAFLLFLNVLPTHARSPVTPEMMVVGIAGGKEWCDDQSPEFEKRSQSAYEGWLKRHQDDVLRVQKNADYPKWLEGWKNELTVRHQRNVRPGHNEQLMLSAMCNDEFIELMGGPPIPDPVFASPQSTWIRFVDALKKGDQKTAVSCLAAEARMAYLENLLGPGRGELQRRVQDMRSIDFKQLDSKTVHMISKQRDESVLGAPFKLILGNWKITGI